MSISRSRTWLGYAGLGLAAGILLLSVKSFVLYSGFYDMRTMPIQPGNWLLDWISFSLGAASTFVAYHLLQRNHEDVGPWEICLFSFMGLGGLLSLPGTIVGGWQLGGSYFLFGGIEMAIVCSLIIALVRSVTSVRPRLAVLLSRPVVRK